MSEPMDHKTRDRILLSLRHSPLWTDKTRDKGETIHPLVCPACGKTEAWTYSKNPWAIICNRGNDCGKRTAITSLYPEVFRGIEEDYPATTEDPRRPATEYLKRRGLGSILEGLDYQYWPKTRDGEGGAVMFRLPGGGDVWSGRIIETTGDKKGNFKGDKSGRLYHHPEIKFSPETPLYVAEGEITGLSLYAMGLNTVSTMGAAARPESFTLPDHSELFLAFDNDRAGHEAARKWKVKYPKAKVLFMDDRESGNDWNDFLRNHGNDPIKARQAFDESLGRYLFNGSLRTAKTAAKWAEIHESSKGWVPEVFEFEGKFYEPNFDKEKGKESNDDKE